MFGLLFLAWSLYEHMVPATSFISTEFSIMTTLMHASKQASKQVYVKFSEIKVFNMTYN